jgi:molybdopterin molybdotransferase
MAICVDEVIKEISSITSIEKYEILPIENCLGRICAQEIIAKYNLPKFNNSAMDGYAINYNDSKNELENIDTILAGDDNHTLLKKNTCIKIMTGARIPENANAVIPKENTELTRSNTIKINTEVKEQQHIRFIGEDIKEGQKLIEPNENINFSKITLLASQGISHIKVYKKPKIVIFSSGEELKLHYEKIEDHQIYNSNTPTFIARVKELGCKVEFIGQAKDSIKSLKKLILNSLDADLIITSGGVSVGDADLTREAFNELDFKTIFDGIIIKPGKPTVFGQINNTYILNLPGNPLASSLIFELFGKTIIQKLKSSKDIFQNVIETKINHDLYNKKGRVTLLPGYFDGRSFEVAQKRSPGMVSTLSGCNSFIALDENTQNLKKDTKIKILPINWEFLTDEKKDFLTHE